MNSSSNGTNSSQSMSIDLFTQIMNHVDQVNRIVSALLFIIYFLLVICLKELRTLNLLYVHHANFVGFLFVLMYLVYFNAMLPNTGNAQLNDALCQLTEYIWGILKYLRAYSILLIALYRLAAVKYVNLFKLVNKSYFNILVPIAVEWLFSVVHFLAIKFAFGTTYGNSFCIDGYSTSFESTLGYLIVSSTICILVPFVIITIIYLVVRSTLLNSAAKMRNRSMSEQKMSEVSTSDKPKAFSLPNLSFRNVSFKSNEPTASSSNGRRRSSTAAKKKSELRKNRQFSLQLISLNICYAICFSMSFILSFRYVISDFNQKFLYVRQILRILNVLFQAMIPVLSIMFNPNIKLSKLGRKLQTNSKVHQNSSTACETENNKY